MTNGLKANELVKMLLNSELFTRAVEKGESLAFDASFYDYLIKNEIATVVNGKLVANTDMVFSFTLVKIPTEIIFSH